MQRTRRWLGPLGIAVGLLFVAGAAHSSSGTRQSARRVTATPIVRDKHTVPVADSRADRARGGPAYQSPSILDTRGRSLRPPAAHVAAAPAITICSSTYTDLQHNDDGQKQIATLPGNANINYVHFTWMYKDVPTPGLRYVNYNAYSPGGGLALADCGVTISAGGGTPADAYGGFSTIALGDDNNAHVAYHQRPLSQQPSGQFAAWVSDQAIPAFNLFADNELPGSVPAEALWPHIAVDQGGGSSGENVFHVAAHGNTPPYNNLIHYWRRIDEFGINSWEGPVVLDEDFSGSFDHHVATDPTSAKVAVIYQQENASGLLDICYMESATNGANWIADGSAIYPQPLTTAGYSNTDITNYSDPDGPQAWLEVTGEYDLDGDLHIVWVQQEYADKTADCSLRHWRNGGPTSTIRRALRWDNQGDMGPRDLWLAYPQIGFGDGATLCTLGPNNPGSAGPTSNRNYVYVTYEQYGGLSAVEQNDMSINQHMNLEIYLAVSNTRGDTWCGSENLCNSKTPGCDGTPGNPCASERDPSLALVVNDAIHISYIEDIDAGDAVFGQGSVSENRVMYAKIPGGTDAYGLCPDIEPVIDVELTNQDHPCPYHADCTTPTIVNEDLIIQNLGCAVLDGSVTVSPMVDWLTVPGGAFTIPPGAAPIVRPVTLNSGAPSISGTCPGVYSTTIVITHTDPDVPTIILNVEFHVKDGYVCPTFTPLSTDDVWLTVGSSERYAYGNPQAGGLARLNPSTGDSSYSIYDGCLIIGAPPNPDTLVYRNIIGHGIGQPGYMPIEDIDINTTAYGTNMGQTWLSVAQSTVDDMIGVDATYIFPQHPDSSEFVIVKYRIYNRTNGLIPGLTIGNAIDLDVMPGPADRGSQAGLMPGDVVPYDKGPQNTGHLVPDYNMIYQQGVDTSGHVVAGNATATRFKGGLTAIQCTAAPRAWIAPSDEYLGPRPTGGFTDGYLYREMTQSGFQILPAFDPDPEEDLHGGMAFEQNVDLQPETVKHYTIGLISSNTGTDETDLLNSTRKAWKYSFGWQEYTDLDSLPENTSESYPYYAIGTHEDGLAGGCCGCEVTKVSGAPELIVGGGEPGNCEGTIEFAGGSACDAPFTATFRVQDLCGDYSDEFTMTVYSSDDCLCDCPHQADYDGDNFLTALDLGNMIDVLFTGKPDIQDTGCPTTRMDFDFDGFATALDLSKLIDHLFAGADGPCDPCNPVQSTCAK